MVFTHGKTTKHYFLYPWAKNQLFVHEIKVRRKAYYCCCFCSWENSQVLPSLPMGKEPTICPWNKLKIDVRKASYYCLYSWENNQPWLCLPRPWAKNQVFVHEIKLGRKTNYYCCFCSWVRSQLLLSLFMGEEPTIVILAHESKW